MTYRRDSPGALPIVARIWRLPLPHQEIRPAYLATIAVDYDWVTDLTDLRPAAQAHTLLA
jgi:hypothetical protein